MSQVTEVPRDALYLSVVAVLAETGRLLQDHSHAPTLYEVLMPFAGRTIVQATPVCYGAVDYYLGLLAERLVRVRGATVASSVEHDQSKVTAEGLRDRQSRSAPRCFAAEEAAMEHEQR